MLTIFTIPKSFKGHINIIQKNAIQSWLQLQPKCEVILFGDDEGVDEVANEFSIRHIPEIEKNKFGTPLLSSAFNIAQKIAKNDILVYTNTDIILTADFVSAVRKIDQPLFLMSGQRWDADVKELIQFNNPDWEKELREKIAKERKLHKPSGMDYCVFPRDLPHNLPRFAVGRPGWDNWLIYHIRSLKIPVIDATEAITVIHQNHNYTHSRFGKKNKVEGPEFQQNIKLARGFSNMLTLRDADWVLTSEGSKRTPFLHRIFSKLSLFYPWRLLLSIKRRIQNFYA